MKNPNFTFISNSVLRKNIERVFRDVFSLEFMLTEEISSEMVSCLRKTIVIYTASIIEALVLWKIKQEIREEKVVLKNEWRYYDPKLIHITDEYEIIWAKRKEEERSVAKLDFNAMLRVCKDEKIFGKRLFEDLDSVRKMRNEIHIDGLEDVVKTYQQRKVDFVQKVLAETIRAVYP